MTAPWERAAHAGAADPPGPDGSDHPGADGPGGVAAPAPTGPVRASADEVPADAGVPGAAGAAAPAADNAGEAVPAEVGALAGAVAALDQLAELPVAEHVARYDALHGELSDALAAIDGI